MNSIIPYGRQHISQQDIDAVVETLKSDFLTQGQKIEEFEKAFAEYIGCNYAVAVANGTAALHLSAMALNVKPGDKVITTPITFAASANCIRYCGGEVVFTDIDPKTYIIDLQEVEQLLNSSPKGAYKGIIPVDFTGYPVNLEKLREIADKYNLWIIEDACHAPGGYFIDSKGEKQQCGNGRFAELAIFSFHPVKHIATGEGGMITTNDKALYEKLKILRTHGIIKSPEKMSENHGRWYYQMKELGYNYRLTDFQCALGLSQLSRADEGLKRRKDIAEKYDKAFHSKGIVKQLRNENYNNAFHLYVIEVKDRKGLYEHLQMNNIFSQVHYIPLHTMPYYNSLGYKKGDYKKAEQYYKGCLSLPIFPSLTNEEQDFVIKKVNEYV